LTRADPKDGGVASQPWLQAVFVDGEFRRWLTVNTTPAHYPY
jgi:hypothetical protein